MQFRERLPFRGSELPEQAYVVGGWVRDRLLGRESPVVDLDLVVPEGSIALASDLAKRYQAGFVVLDREREIARLVWLQATVDIAKQVGATLEEDLGHRDFTMNAIAVPCGALDGAGNFPAAAAIDPLGGQKDVQARLVRAIARENLIADPLRVLRGYRQAAQLGFALEATTRGWLRELAPYLAKVAPERVCAELCYLLALPAAGLLEALEDRILAAWLPPSQLRPERFGAMDGAIAQLLALEPNLTGYFARGLAGNRTVAVIARLAALLKAATLMPPLHFSKVEYRFCLGILRHLPQFWAFLQTEPTPRQRHPFQQATQDTLPAIAAVALADGASIAAIQGWIERWLHPSQPLPVSGDDLQATLGLRPGPQLGALLKELAIAQAEGKITDRESALAYSRLWLPRQVF
ncbi:MAG: CCA tRNA nucleotidyltransferase [Pseudanabaenaceae cyanobacterium]